MRVLALTLLVLAACPADPSSGDTTSTPIESSSSSASEPPTSGPIPDACTNGEVDPDERCDGSGLCDAWCQDGAFVFARSQVGFALNNDNFETMCNPGPHTSSRKYVPYFPMEADALKPTPLMTGGYSTTCKLPVVEPAKWQSLAALEDVQLGELCGNQGQSLAAWDRMWLSYCVDGHAMFREANGDVVQGTCSPFSDDTTEALVLCVAQP